VSFDWRSGGEYNSPFSIVCIAGGNRLLGCSRHKNPTRCHKQCRRTSGGTSRGIVKLVPLPADQSINQSVHQSGTRRPRGEEDERMKGYILILVDSTVSATLYLLTCRKVLRRHPLLSSSIP
jgi:hypothetical protein